MWPGCSQRGRAHDERPQGEDTVRRVTIELTENEGYIVTHEWSCENDESAPHGYIESYRNAYSESEYMKAAYDALAAVDLESALKGH